MICEKVNFFKGWIQKVKYVHLDLQILNAYMLYYNECNYGINVNIVS
jgi:hypothetical protein